MTLPPNRIGAIRGPNGATLDDVVALLGDLTATNANIALTLSTMQGDIAQLTADTRALVGDPSAFPVSWDGAVSYLLATLGAASPPRSIAAELQDMRALLLSLAISQGAGGTAPYSNFSLPYLNISEIFRVLSSEVGENLYGRLGTLRDNSTALLQSVGTFSSEPSNETVKTLLDALLLCCEGGPPPPGEVFDPPAANCNAQVIAWQECTLVERFDQGVGGQRVFAVVFPATITGFPLLGSVLLNSPEGEPALGSLSVGDLDFLQYDLCIAWSFSATTPLFNYAVQVDALPVAGPFNSYVGQTPPVDNPGSQYTNFFVRDLGNVNYVFRANFAFDTGVVPVGKVWVGAAGVGGF